MPDLISLKQARERLWTKGLPADSGPSDISQADETDYIRFNDRLNMVVERFFSSIISARSYRKINVPVYDGQFTLPRDVKSALQVTLLDEENRGCCPLFIYSRFHQFAECCDECNDCRPVQPISENAQTFRVPEAGFRLRVTSTQDNGNYTLIGGTDTSDDEYSDSVTLEITNGSATTTREWNTLPRMVKPVTNKACEVYAVDADNVATLIAVHAPGETNPAYQRYSCPTNQEGFAARVLTRLAYVRIAGDDDIVIPSNYGALGLGLQALRYEDVSDWDRANAVWAQALSLIDSDKQLLEGAEAQVPIVRNMMGFGCSDQATNGWGPWGGYVIGGGYPYYGR